jgi:hypothetical protein
MRSSQWPSVRLFAQRACIVAWLALSFASALNVASLRRSPVASFAPHLKYGFVMFNHFPVDIEVATFVEDGSSTVRSLAELESTISVGYAESRAFLNLRKREWLPWLCTRHPHRRFSVEILRMRIENPPTVVGTTHYRCDGHGLR